MQDAFLSYENKLMFFYQNRKNTSQGYTFPENNSKYNRKVFKKFNFSMNTGNFPPNGYIFLGKIKLTGFFSAKTIALSGHVQAGGTLPGSAILQVQSPKAAFPFPEKKPWLRLTATQQTAFCLDTCIFQLHGKNLISRSAGQSDRRQFLGQQKAAAPGTI